MHVNRQAIQASSLAFSMLPGIMASYGLEDAMLQATLIPSFQTAIHSRLLILNHDSMSIVITHYLCSKMAKMADHEILDKLLGNNELKKM